MSSRTRTTYLSVVAVGELSSNSPSLQPLMRMQTRLEVAVGARLSYSFDEHVRTTSQILRRSVQKRRERE